MKYLPLLFLTFLFSCTEPQQTNTEETNAPASDTLTEVEHLAWQVMEESGGLDNWQNIPAITWNFFGRRKLLWLKHKHLVRIDFLNNDLQMWVDLQNPKQGQVKYKGTYLAGDSLQNFLGKANSIWINDSYWLAFPFKLLDDGVNLSIGDRDTTMLGEDSQTFWMSFNEVGDTPQNRYRVYVSDTSGLINQWDFYKDSTSTVPDLATTFENYVEYDGVLISQKRSGFELSDIQTFDKFDVATLKNLEQTLNW